MNFDIEWKNSRDLFMNKLKNGNFSFDKVKPHLFDFENVKSHMFVRANDGWFDYYYNPFTGAKKRVLDKSDYLFLGEIYGI